MCGYQPVEVRYNRVLPEGHAGGGHRGWLRYTGLQIAPGAREGTYQGPSDAPDLC